MPGKDATWLAPDWRATDGITIDRKRTSNWSEPREENDDSSRKRALARPSGQCLPQRTQSARPAVELLSGVHSLPHNIITEQQQTLASFLDKVAEHVTQGTRTAGMEGVVIRDQLSFLICAFINFFSSFFKFL